VTVHPPAASPAVAARCAQLSDVLPQRLESLRPRVITPRTPLVHVWGSPPVVLTCGVPPPAGYLPKSSETTAVNGVRWFEQAGADGVIWTALRPGVGAGQTTYVRLQIPTSYSGQGAFLVDLADALKSGLPGRAPFVGSAQTGSSPDRVIDQPGDQGPVVDAGGRPHLRKHRDRSEPGHRVDLVDKQRLLGG
jgi:hypothetical protein